MKAYVWHWMGILIESSLVKYEPITYMGNVRKTRIKKKKIKKGPWAGKTKEVPEDYYVREEVTHTLSVVEFNTLQDLLDFADAHSGVTLRPPNKDFPLWSICVDHNGKFIQR